ncbi:MAG: globin [Akkermansiaceae bacterium]|nr:globin [Akkermansiaceae bacterium]
MNEAAIWKTLGEEGFGRLVAAFYRRIPGDDLLGPMYPDGDLSGAEARLRDFLLFRFGGVPRYIEERGHPRLRMRHAPFAIGENERDRWLQLMGEAVRECEVPPAAAEPLMEFFAGVADFMRNR